MDNIDLTSVTAEKKQNKFVKVLRAVFVHNLGYKLLALGTSVALWALAVLLA